MWTVGGIALVALTVQVTKSGVDVLVVLALCGIVVAIERTLGDWAAELVGPGWASVALAALIAPIVWLLFAKGGKVDRLYAEAERAGYYTLFAGRATSAPSPSRPAALAAQTPSSRSRPLPSGRGALTINVPGSSRLSSPHTASEGRDVGRTAITRSRARSAVRLETPGRSAPGRGVTIRAHVTVDGVPLSGASVAFSINGIPGRLTVTDQNGVAAVVLAPKRGRTYEVGARVFGSPRYRESSARASLHFDG